MAGRFVIVRRLGSGGFGIVEQAERVTDDGTVIEQGLARKALLPRYLDDVDALGRFRREVRMLGEMDHPNVLPVIDHDLSASPPWFVMPLADCSLRDALCERRRTKGWIATIFAGMLAGTAYAHRERHIVHRDLKPENVLLLDGVPKISDFGLGKRLDANTQRLTASNVGLGTRVYMAPEQFEDATRVGPQADVYALGKILWEMLSGQLPQPHPPQLEDVPGRFREFIARCTAYAPHERYLNAAAAQEAFEPLMGLARASDPHRELVDLLELWEQLPPYDDRDARDRIEVELLAHRDSETLHREVVPQLPQTLLGALDPDVVAVIAERYARHLQGPIEEEERAAAARFWRRVFNVGHAAQQRLALEQLIGLGGDSRDGQIGELLARMLGGIGNDESAALAADVLLERAHDAAWLRPHLEQRTLRAPIVRALAAADEPR